MQLLTDGPVKRITFSSGPCWLCSGKFLLPRAGQWRGLINITEETDRIGKTSLSRPAGGRRRAGGKPVSCSCSNSLKTDPESDEFTLNTLLPTERSVQGPNGPLDPHRGQISWHKASYLRKHGRSNNYCSHFKRWITKSLQTETI